MEVKKQLIINADDFGMSDAVNEAVIKACETGILTSASLMANAPSYDNAISLIHSVKGLSIGVHLNIIEFSTLKKELKQDSLLYDKNGKYNNNFIQLLLKSFDKEFLQEIEEDFRLQIEKILQNTDVDHIDSHVHVHAIPNIFKVVLKLADEYNIKNIRTQFEYPYFIPEAKKYISLKYPVNIIKLLLLNSFTLINRESLKKYDLKTNKNFIGVNYTGYMDENTLKYALGNISERTEALFHPSTDININGRYREYIALLNKELKQKINRLGITLINFSDEVKSLE